MTPAVFQRERILSRDFVLVCLGNVVSWSSMNVLVSTLPIYIVLLGIPEAQLGIVLGVFTISAVIARLLVGREIDRRGRRWFLLAGPVVFFCASGFYNWARDFGTLVAVRLLHGAGMAIFSVAAIAIVADLAPPFRIGEALGYFSTLGALSMLIAPPLGMALYEGSGFTVMFIFAASLALAALAIFLPVEETVDPAAISSNQDRKTIVFSRGALYPSFLMAALSITFGSVYSFVPLYALEKGMANPGFFYTVYSIGAAVSRLIAGPLSDRWGRTAVAVPAMVISSVGTALLAMVSSTPTFLVLAVVYGFGFGGAFPVFSAMVVDRVPIEELGAAMGVFTAAVDLGWGLGTVIWGFVLEYSSFEVVYLAASVIPALALLTFPLTRWRRGRQREGI